MQEERYLDNVILVPRVCCFDHSPSLFHCIEHLWWNKKPSTKCTLATGLLGRQISKMTLWQHSLKSTTPPHLGSDLICEAFDKPLWVCPHNDSCSTNGKRRYSRAVCQGQTKRSNGWATAATFGEQVWYTKSNYEKVPHIYSSHVLEDGFAFSFLNKLRPTG